MVSITRISSRDWSSTWAWPDLTKPRRNSSQCKGLPVPRYSWISSTTLGGPLVKPTDTSNCSSSSLFISSRIISSALCFWSLSISLIDAMSSLFESLTESNSAVGFSSSSLLSFSSRISSLNNSILLSSAHCRSSKTIPSGEFFTCFLTAVVTSCITCPLLAASESESLDNPNRVPTPGRLASWSSSPLNALLDWSIFDCWRPRSPKPNNGPRDLLMRPKGSELRSLFSGGLSHDVLVMTKLSASNFFVISEIKRVLPIPCSPTTIRQWNPFNENVSVNLKMLAVLRSTHLGW